MDNTIRVDPAELAGVANELGNVAPRLTVSSPPDVSACQSSGVTRVLNAFTQELETNRQDIQEVLQVTADGVIKTANDFSEFDAELTAEFARVMPR